MGARGFYIIIKNNDTNNNNIQHEPVPTRVLNPNASEASYKPKQTETYTGVEQSGGNFPGKEYT